MMPFTAKETLDSVKIDILGKLIQTKRGHNFLLVFTDRFKKLNPTIPIKRITETAVEDNFENHFSL